MVSWVMRPFTSSNTGDSSMVEIIFAVAVLVIALVWIARAVRQKDSFVLHFSRGDFMRELNKRCEHEPAAL